MAHVATYKEHRLPKLAESMADYIKAELERIMERSATRTLPRSRRTIVKNLLMRPLRNAVRASRQRFDVVADLPSAPR